MDRRFWCLIVSLLVLINFILDIPALAQTDEYSQYDLDVTLDPTTRTLSGTQQLDYYNDTGVELNEVSFFLLANLGRSPNPYLDMSLQDGAYPDGFDPSWTKVSSVTDAAGQALSFSMEAMPPMLQTFSLEDTVLRVQLPQTLIAGARVTLNLDFETKFPHAANIDSVYYQGVFTWRFAWNPIVVGSGFFDEHQFNLATARYSARLTLPEELVVAAGVDHQTVESVQDGWQTVLLENNVPTRSISLAIGADFGVYTLNHDRVQILSYYLPGHQSQARLAASFAASQIDYYQERFGQYGYKRLVIVDNPGPGSYGMASDGMILLGTDNYRFKDLLVPGLADRVLEWLIAHEVGHLWWGIGVGTDFNAENWLSEGLAQYLSLSYFEDKYGSFDANLLGPLGKGLIEQTIKDEFGYFNLRQHNIELSYLDAFRNRFDEAIIKRGEDVEYANATGTLIYNKGYLVLRALEGLLGRETMLEVLRTTYEQYGHKAASVEILKGMAEDVSGQDLDSFFQSWLYGNDFLDVAVQAVVTSKTDAQAYATEVTLIKRGQAIYPITVRVMTVDGERVEQTWVTDSQRATLNFNTTSPVERVSVDPEEMSPDVNRYNNYHPRKLEVKFGESDFPLDAYFIRVDPTGIRGQLRLDHLWSINVIPRVEFDLEEDQEVSADADNAHIFLDGVATFGAFLDRGLSVSALLTFSDYELQTQQPNPKISGEVGVNWTLFEHPQVGTPGKFWYAANNVRLAVGVLGTLLDPIGFVGADYTRQDILSLGMAHRVSLRTGLAQNTPFVRGNWSGYKRLRLAHATYLDLRASAGAGLQALPETMQLRLDDLQGFEETFSGDRKMFGQLTLVLPTLRTLNFSLMNLAVLDSATLGGFVQGGQTWIVDETFSTDRLKAEIGVKANFGISLTLGLSLNFNVGYAYPVLGAPDEAMGKLFLDVGGLF